MEFINVVTGEGRLKKNRMSVDGGGLGQAGRTGCLQRILVHEAGERTTQNYVKLGQKAEGGSPK